MLSCKFIMASGGESVVDLLFLVGVRHSSDPVCLLENNLTAEYSLVPPGRQWLDCRSFVGSQQWTAVRHIKGVMVALYDLKVHL